MHFVYYNAVDYPLNLKLIKYLSSTNLKNNSIKTKSKKYLN